MRGSRRRPPVSSGYTCTYRDAHGLDITHLAPCDKWLGIQPGHTLVAHCPCNPKVSKYSRKVLVHNDLEAKRA